MGAQGCRAKLPSDARLPTLAALRRDSNYITGWKLFRVIGQGCQDCQQRRNSIETCPLFPTSVIRGPVAPLQCFPRAVAGLLSIDCMINRSTCATHALQLRAAPDRNLLSGFGPRR